MRVLLSDGSGLTSRQVATRLADRGDEVHVVSPDPICLCRFTRHVRRVHRVPPYGHDPFAWLEATLDVLGAGFDAALATQEQVAVLSLEAGRVRELGVALAVPPFAALRQVQDKLAAHATLTRLSLPQPDAVVMRSRQELLETGPPVYVKTPVGTATIGVQYVAGRVALERAARDLPGGEAVLVQQPVAGPLMMVQSVFAHGRLVTWHANYRTRLGANGGASNKRSVVLPDAMQQVARLGEALGWHGALSLDAILTTDGPRWIDVNPRLVEPGNAWRAGVDLVGALMDVTLGREPAAMPAGRPDVATHQLLIAVLGAAQRSGARRAVLRELAGAATGRGPYRKSAEELAPVRGDALAAVPVAAAAGAALAAPRLSRAFTGSAVANYALTPAAWRTICAAADDLPRPAPSAPIPARPA